MSIKRICVGTIIFIMANSIFAGVINERNPEYQYSMDRLLAAMQSLEQARAEISESKRLHALPGFNYDQLITAIELISNPLNQYVTPHKRTMMYRIIRPNNRYFIKPQRLKDENNFRQNSTVKE